MCVREKKEARTMISRSVSRFTLNGMFLITIAVGIISSSSPPPGVPGAMPGVMTCPPRTGEPPDDEMSELLFGDRERLSGMGTFSSSIVATAGPRIRAAVLSVIALQWHLLCS